MIRVTYEFADVAAAMEHFKRAGDDGRISHGKADTQSANGVYKPVADAQQVAETAPASAPAEGGGVTVEDVRQEFTRYVGRAGGRTAATGIEICKAHGVPNCARDNLGKLAPEQLRVLKRALETAGPDHPLGEGA